MTKSPLLFTARRAIISHMKRLKAMLLAALFLNILIVPFARFSTAKAELAGEYGYVDEGASVAFCSDKNTATQLFFIPETYCVKILYRDGDWLRVVYGEDAPPYRALEGFVLDDGLVFSDERPERPYLYITFKVAFSPKDDSGYLPGLGDAEFDAAYYGSYTVGTQSYSYVLCNGNFGYVGKTITDAPKNPIPSKPTSTIPTQPSVKQDNSVAMITVVLVGVAVLTLAVLLVSTRKQGSNR